MLASDRCSDAGPCAGLVLGAGFIQSVGMLTPEIKFARANGCSIAYMDYGTGPVTICAVPPSAQNVEMAWDWPGTRRMFERYASFSRQLAFDKRGTGMSDRSLDIPTIDERVDEVAAVMDHAGVDRAFIHGVSEGGPMAIMFAATYPERVEGLILEATGASLRSDEERALLADPAFLEGHTRRGAEFAEAWGTPHSRTLSVFAPSALEDEELVEWWPRYERQAANQDAVLELFRLANDMDARAVVPRVECPVLIVHRTGDQVVLVDRARETCALFEEAGADVTLVEVEGVDHFTFVGDIGPIADAIERFTTGRVRDRLPLEERRIEIRTMGRFEVTVDGESVPTGDWGSKRARTLLKRLVAARGWPVTRDELFELLWPGDTSDRLGARLSVQLSAVRRVLRGGVIADRSSIRLDTTRLEIDVDAWFSLDGDAEIVEAYVGDFLPDDRYDDWSVPLRDEMRDRFISAARRLIASGDDGVEVVRLLRRVVEVDPYDEPTHRALVRRLHADGRPMEAASAHERYVAVMAELDLPASSLDDIIG